jgi:uncharacterized membrane protein YfcA
MKALSVLKGALKKRRGAVIDLKAFIVFLIALMVGGFVYGFLADVLPEGVTGNDLIGFLLSALVIFIIYSWLVKKLRAPPR